MKNYVSNIINNRWKIGIPITMDILQTKILCHVKKHIQEPNYKLFSPFYLEDNKKIKTFLKCSPEYSQFTRRYYSVCIDGAYRVRKLFKEEDFDVVISVDEIRK